MAETHVVSALKDLKERRVKLATEIGRLREELRQRVIDLDHVKSVLLADVHGDTGRIILETLRTATTPLSTDKVCEAVMKARGLDTDDKGLCRLMMRRTIANLGHWQRKRGLIRAMPGVGQQLMWEIVR